MRIFRVSTQRYTREAWTYTKYQANLLNGINVICISIWAKLGLLCRSYQFYLAINNSKAWIFKTSQDICFILSLNGSICVRGTINVMSTKSIFLEWIEYITLVLCTEFEKFIQKKVNVFFYCFNVFFLMSTIFEGGTRRNSECNITNLRKL